MIRRSLLRTRNGLRYAAGRNPPQLGMSPKRVVWQRDKARLWRYDSDQVRFSPPVVLVHSLVSRSYILDLRPGNSMVESLRNAGFDVFLLDWGVPDEVDAENTLETYCDEYLPLAVRAACRRDPGATRSRSPATASAACSRSCTPPAIADARVRNLVTMATPVDLDEMGAMVALIREGRLDPDDLVDETGNVPADVLHNGFKMLVPTDQAVQYANLWQNLWNDEFVEGYGAMAQWARDHVPFPGRGVPPDRRAPGPPQPAGRRDGPARRPRLPPGGHRLPRPEHHGREGHGRADRRHRAARRA